MLLLYLDRATLTRLNLSKTRWRKVCENFACCYKQRRSARSFHSKTFLKWSNVNIAQKPSMKIGFYSNTSEKYTNGSHSSSVGNVKKNLKENVTLTVMKKLAVVVKDVTHNLIRSKKKRTTHANHLKNPELQKTSTRSQFSVQVLNYAQNHHPHNLNQSW